MGRTLLFERFDEVLSTARPRDALGALADLETVQPYARTAEDTRLMMGGYGKWALGIGFDEAASPWAQWYGPTAFQLAFGAPLSNLRGFAGVGDRSISHVDGAASIIAPVTTPTTQFNLTATDGLGLFGLGYIQTINAALRTVVNKWDTAGGGKGYGVFVDPATGFRGTTRTDAGVAIGAAPPLQQWFAWGYVVDRATGKQRTGTRTVLTGVTALSAEANVSATNESNAFQYQIGSGAGLGAMPMLIPVHYVAHGADAGNAMSANLGDILASFCARVQSVPTVVDAAAGRGRSFVALSRSGYEATDVAAGNTIATRDCSVQALVRWDILDQAAAASWSLTKNAPTFAWDSGASTIETIAGDGYLEHVATLPDVGDTQRIIGLSYNDTNQDYVAIDYSVELMGDGTFPHFLWVIEQSVHLLQTTYAIGDVIQIKRVGTTVTYWKNGVLIYTSLTASSGPLRVDSSIAYNTGVLGSIRLFEGGAPKALTWQNPVNVVVTPDSGRGVIYARGKGGSAPQYLSAGVELRVVSAAAGIGELGWVWQDIAGVLKRQVGGQFVVPNGYIMVTATRRWVSSTQVILRYYVGGTLLAEVESVDGLIGGGTTGTTTIGARFDSVYVDFFDGVIDELRVLDYELTGEEVSATWDRITKFQPLGYELVKQFHPPGFPISENPSSRVQRETNIWGQTLGYAGAQAENMRANMLPDRAYGPVLEQWEGIVKQPAKPGDSVDTRRARVVGRLRQRAGVSIPGVEEALRELVGTDPDNLEIIAYAQEAIEHFERPTVWSTGSGVKLEKTGGVAATWDSGAAATVDFLTGDGWLEIVASETGKYRAVGLSTPSGSPSTIVITIGRGIYLKGGGTPTQYAITEGVTEHVTGTYATGDVFRLKREGTTLRAYHNSTLVWTYAGAVSGNLMVDSAFFDSNATIQNARLYAVEDTEVREIGLSTWATTNVTRTPAHYTPFRDGYLKKSGGVDATEDAGASSVETIAGDGYVETTAVETNKFRFFGLSLDDPNYLLASMLYAIQLDNAGNTNVYELGVLKSAGPTYAANDVLRVERIGSTVYYKKNGVTFYTSLVASASALRIDTLMYSSASTLQAIKLVDAGERVPITWQKTQNVQAYADATRVQGANAEDLQYTGGATMNWRTARRAVAHMPLFRTTDGFRAEGWGAHLLTKIEPIALPDRAEVGIALMDLTRHHVFMLGLRNNGGTYRIITELVSAGVSAGATNRAVTALQAHWLHLFVQAPSPVVGGAIAAGNWNFTAEWSVTSRFAGYTSYANVAHPGRFQWAALYLRSFGGTLSGATDAYFDETRLFTPYGDRSLYFFAYRAPSLAGTPDLLGGRGVVDGLRHAHTRASLITSKTLLYDTDGHGYDVGPLGGY